MNNINTQLNKTIKDTIDTNFLELKEILSPMDPIMIFYNIYCNGNKDEIEQMLKSKYTKEEADDFINAINTLLKICDFDCN